MSTTLSRILAASALVAALPLQAQIQPRVLVFSKTAGFRHTSIEPGIAAVRKLGAENGFAVDATEDASVFTDRNLKKYREVIFLSTTGDVLDLVQQDALERYIEAGGGWVGVHSATDTEYDWPWYNRLAGAYFSSHPGNPNVRKGTFRVIDATHPSTQGLPARWERTDEFYNYKDIQPDIKVLVDIDETSYAGGTNGARHPMSWFHEFDGGRAWYTNMGHTDETFSEPLFLKHLLGGIKWAMAGTLDYKRARPEENRFTKVVLATPLEEPVELAVLPPDERVLFIQRRGKIMLWTPKSNETRQIGFIPVSLKYATGDQAEDGLLGLAADPNFGQNGFVYMYYSPAGTVPKNVLSRFTMHGDSIDMASEKVMLEIPTQRDQCCHTGGSIAFDANGNLFMSTGDNSNPFMNGYAPIDERPNRSPWDAQKSSANTNDLRGKIIRIHPEPDGSYTIPDGNLFPKGTPLTRPEIYTMGHRNPYRISVDKHTGYLYWGDVGPDANVDSAGKGPAGQDEIGQARRAGNFGWPYFVGDNKAYYDVDYASGHVGPLFDAMSPTNDSPNNTGLHDLPRAQKAWIWYPYGASSEFPIVGTGGRTAMAGPVYYRSDFTSAQRPWPAYYDRKFLEYEWMRGWINAVTMDSSGDIASIERFLPSQKFSNPVDMDFGPSGDLFMLEYGTGWFQGNDDARLVRIEFNSGNRAPTVIASVDKPMAAVPMRVKLSASGTTDADDDSLRYSWAVTDAKGKVVRRLTGESPALALVTPGVYTATLTVTDAQGASNTAQVPITAGNEPPHVALDVAGNKTFFFPGTPVKYAVRVTDREDGSLASRRIAANRVRVSADYLAEAPPRGAKEQGASTSPHAEGLRLIQANDCLACHQFDRKSIGPTYTAVAEKYKDDSTATQRLVRKVIEGGRGVWGDVAMPAHPKLSEREANMMVTYIRSLATPKSDVATLPATGEYLAPDSAMKSPTGVIVLRAAYTDRGATGLPGVTSDTTVVLRAPTVVVSSGELSQGASKMKVEQLPVEITIVNRSGAFSKLEGIDLTGITGVTFMATAPAQYGAQGGSIEVHADSATGALLGKTEMIAPQTGAGAPVTVRAALTPTSGIHDLYIVVRNDAVKQDQMLMVLMTATFDEKTP
ncbi:MAG TPA: ThuA domain-containing protein [Gemmatimonadaceae bacterium]|nr:ThuA domain-containing protein [Gemmatimonadaceae bacterium]